MAKNWIKRSLRATKGYFSVPQASPWRAVTLEEYSTQRMQNAQQSGLPRYPENIPNDQEVERINREKLEIERLDQDRESLNLNLKAQHRIMIATLITALVALISAAAAIYISLHTKPSVVNVYVSKRW
jgi:hypothetical protein